MLQFNIITVGKLKEAYWQEAVSEYTKRLKPYARVDVVELKEEAFDEKSNVEVVKSREAEKIQAALEKLPGAFVIALDAHGKQFSSEGFAQELGKITMQHGSNLVFIIGGPRGLHESVLANAQLKLSFGSFTLTHQMARIILLEQFYRAMMIQNNRPYHY
jgi:23S rRNA (pseudouridine1915-N3)-methyltransferase